MTSYKSSLDIKKITFIGIYVVCEAGGVGSNVG